MRCGDWRHLQQAVENIQMGTHTHIHTFIYTFPHAHIYVHIKGERKKMQFEEILQYLPLCLLTLLSWLYAVTTDGWWGLPIITFTSCGAWKSSDEIVRGGVTPRGKGHIQFGVVWSKSKGAAISVRSPWRWLKFIISSSSIAEYGSVSIKDMLQ